MPVSSRTPAGNSHISGRAKEELSAEFKSAERRCHLGAPRATNWSKITPTWRASNSIRCELAHQRCVSKRATGLIISALCLQFNFPTISERLSLCVCTCSADYCCHIDHLSISVCGVVNTWVITETLSNIDLSCKSKQRQRVEFVTCCVIGAWLALHSLHTHATHPPTQLKYFNKLNAHRLLLRFDSLTLHGLEQLRNHVIMSERERLTLLIVS